MSEFILQIVLYFTTTSSIFLGGGWFIHYRSGKKKANAEANTQRISANKDAVDLAEDISKKYVELVKITMSDHHDILLKIQIRIDEIENEIKLIGEFLNGDYNKFKIKKIKKTTENE